jgi:hypothetical protein
MASPLVKMVTAPFSDRVLSAGLREKVLLKEYRQR